MQESPQPSEETTQLRCARCAVELTPGHGTLYEVRIQAVADPFPPDLPDWDVATIRREIDRTLEAMRDLSPEAAMEQVYRSLTVHLCLPCYRRWIDDPVGRISDNDISRVAPRS